MSKKVRRSIRVPDKYIKILDRLINLGVTPCYSEAVRTAVNRLISRDINISEKINILVNTDLLIENKLRQTKLDEFFL